MMPVCLIMPLAYTTSRLSAANIDDEPTEFLLPRWTRAASEGRSPVEHNIVHFKLQALTLRSHFAAGSGSRGRRGSNLDAAPRMPTGWYAILAIHEKMLADGWMTWFLAGRLMVLAFLITSWTSSSRSRGGGATG